MHEVLVNRLGGLSLPRKSVVRLTDRPDMTLDVYRGRKTTMQQQQSMQVLHISTGISGRRLYKSGDIHVTSFIVSKHEIHFPAIGMECKSMRT